MALSLSPRYGVSLACGGAGALELLRASSGNRGGSGKLPSSDAEALQIINGFRDPGAAPLNAGDVHIHYLEAANDSFIGDRFLFLGESTLKNLAEDAQRGFAFMNSHRTGGWLSSAELPMGRTFCGRYEKVEREENPQPGSPSHRVIAGIYMKSGVSPNGAGGPSTDDLHAMIDARTIFDCSVGVYGGKIVCDVCGAGLYDYDPETGDYLCPHYPGSLHSMSAAMVEKQKARGVTDGRASATLQDGHGNEVSAVYDGAVTGAGFLKAALALQKEPESFTLCTVAFDLSAGYGTPLTASDLLALVEGNPEAFAQLASAGTPKDGKNPTFIPTPGDPSPQGKTPMKLSFQAAKEAVRKAFNLAADEPLEIEGVAEAPVAPPATIPPAAPAVDEALTKQVADISAQVKTTTETLAAQTGIIKSLTEQLENAQKSTAEKEHDAKLASAKARIVALKRAFKITPAGEKSLTEKLEKDVDSALFAIEVFEKNAPIASVNGVPGYTEEPAGDGVEEFADESPAQLAARVQKLAAEYVKEHKETKLHEAMQIVLDENPQLARAYSAARAGGVK